MIIMIHALFKLLCIYVVHKCLLKFLFGWQVSKYMYINKFLSFYILFPILQVVQKNSAELTN